MNLVFDTNIVLDWLLFERRDVEVLRQGIQSGRIALIASPLTVDELARVLAYPQFELKPSRQAEILAAYQSHAKETALPDGFSRQNLFLPQEFPRCRDGDDEHFLALTYHARADALVTKDKVVLKMRKRARKFGVTIVDVRQLNAMVSGAALE